MIFVTGTTNKEALLEMFHVLLNVSVMWLA